MEEGFPHPSDLALIRDEGFKSADAHYGAHEFQLPLLGFCGGAGGRSRTFRGALGLRSPLPLVPVTHVGQRATGSLQRRKLHHEHFSVYVHSQLHPQVEGKTNTSERRNEVDANPRGNGKAAADSQSNSQAIGVTIARVRRASRLDVRFDGFEGELLVLGY